MTDGSLQGGDATDDGGESKVGVVVLGVVVGLGRRGQMSRCIWHRPEMGGRRRERGQRSVRRRLIWNGRGRVEFELSNDGESQPPFASLVAKIQHGQNRGVGLAGALCRARSCLVGEHSVDGLSRRLSFGGLEICRQPCEPPRVDSRESIVPCWMVDCWWSGQKLWKDGPGTSAGIAGGSVVLWGFH